MSKTCHFFSFYLCLNPADRDATILGAFGLFLTYLMAWYGQSLIAMQIMQVNPFN